MYNIPVNPTKSDLVPSLSYIFRNIHGTIAKSTDIQFPIRLETRLNKFLHIKNVGMVDCYRISLHYLRNTKESNFYGLNDFIIQKALTNIFNSVNFSDIRHYNESFTGEISFEDKDVFLRNSSELKIGLSDENINGLGDKKYILKYFTVSLKYLNENGTFRVYKNHVQNIAQENSYANQVAQNLCKSSESVSTSANTEIDKYNQEISAVKSQIRENEEKLLNLGLVDHEDDDGLVSEIRSIDFENTKISKTPDYLHQNDYHEVRFVKKPFWSPSHFTNYCIESVNINDRESFLNILDFTLIFNYKNKQNTNLRGQSGRNSLSGCSEPTKNVPNLDHLSFYRDSDHKRSNFEQSTDLHQMDAKYCDFTVFVVQNITKYFSIQTNLYLTGKNTIISDLKFIKKFYIDLFVKSSNQQKSKVSFLINRTVKDLLKLLSFIEERCSVKRNDIIDIFLLLRFLSQNSNQKNSNTKGSTNNDQNIPQFTEYIENLQNVYTKQFIAERREQIIEFIECDQENDILPKKSSSYQENTILTVEVEQILKNIFSFNNHKLDLSLLSPRVLLIFVFHSLYQTLNALKKRCIRNTHVRKSKLSFFDQKIIKTFERCFMILNTVQRVESHGNSEIKLQHSPKTLIEIQATTSFYSESLLNLIEICFSAILKQIDFLEEKKRIYEFIKAFGVHILWEFPSYYSTDSEFETSEDSTPFIRVKIPQFQSLSDLHNVVVFDSTFELFVLNEVHRLVEIEIQENIKHISKKRRTFTKKRSNLTAEIDSSDSSSSENRNLMQLPFLHKYSALTIKLADGTELYVSDIVKMRAFKTVDNDVEIVSGYV